MSKPAIMRSHVEVDPPSDSLPNSFCPCLYEKFLDPRKDVKKFSFRKIRRLIKKKASYLTLWICSKIESISWFDSLLLRKELPNFSSISEKFYRGGQPLELGYRELARMGIKTVVNLRTACTKPFLTTSLTLRVIHLPFKPQSPKWEHVVSFLKIAKEYLHEPIFIHCFHGSDRTGMLCAIYRIVFQNWSKHEALQEMISGGFGFHRFFQQNLIKFIIDLDIALLKQTAGIA